MRTFLGALVCSLLLAPVSARAQSDATLTGTVKDTSGAVIPGATITARHVATNDVRTTTSGPEGHYRLTNLPRGNYDVKAEIQGFQPINQTGVLLTVGDTVRLDFAMTSANRSGSAASTRPNGLVRHTIRQTTPCARIDRVRIRI